MEEMIEITYRNISNGNTVTFPIVILDNPLAHDWKHALKELLINKNRIEKGFCFHGFPNTPRDLDYLCNELNTHIQTINNDPIDYVIEDYFTPDTVRFNDGYPLGEWMLGLTIKHLIMNRLHNHFEILQGTVGKISPLYNEAQEKTKRAIQQLNLLCHEVESLVLSQRKAIRSPEWIRPSQITSFKNAPRYKLTDEHRKLFVQNGYDRKFGYVYMHWAQIGKTLFEVWRDEEAPELTKTVCDAITQLEYYSGEFDIEFGRDVRYGQHEWHTGEIDRFKSWILQNNLSYTDPKLSLGYLPIAKIDYSGTPEDLWNTIGNHFDVYKIAVDDKEYIYDYTWE